MELGVLSSLIVLILASRLLGFMFRKYEYQAMIGEVLGGFILGSMILGLIQPTTELGLFADFGIIMIMMVAGMQTNFDSFTKNIKSSSIVGFLGVIITFIVVYFPLVALGFDWTAILFLAAIMSNSAIEVCAGVFVKSEHPRLRAVVLGASFVDDIIAVFIIGIVASTVFGNAPLDAGFIATLSMKIAVFMIISLFVVTRIVEVLFDKIRHKEGSEKLLLTSTFLLAFAFAIAARAVGLHEVIGAYIAGLIVGKWGTKVGPMLKRRIAWNNMNDDLDAMLKAVFSPIFFGYMGLLLSQERLPSTEYLLILSITGLLLGLGFIGKYLGCGGGALLCGFRGKASFMLGTAMLGRGALEMILAKYAMDAGIIGPEIFSALILFILVTIIAAPLLYGYTEKIWGDEIE